jgi:hypothetical protein
MGSRVDLDPCPRESGAGHDVVHLAVNDPSVAVIDPEKLFSSVPTWGRPFAVSAAAACLVHR